MLYPGLSLADVNLDSYKIDEVRNRFLVSVGALLLLFPSLSSTKLVLFFMCLSFSCSRGDRRRAAAGLEELFRCFQLSLSLCDGYPMVLVVPAD
jgi:hypothetical protein